MDPVKAVMERSERMIKEWAETKHAYAREEDAETLIALLKDREGETQAMELLRKQPELALYKGSYPLRVAARCGRKVSLLKRLVECGAQPEAPTTYDDHYSMITYTQGALLAAVLGKNFEAVCYFVHECGLKQPPMHPASREPQLDDSALEHALKVGPEMVDVLLAAGWRITASMAYHLRNIADESHFLHFLKQFHAAFKTADEWAALIRNAVQYTHARLLETLKLVPEPLVSEIDFVSIVSQLIYHHSLEFHDDSDEEKRLLTLLNDPRYRVSINHTTLQHSLAWNGGVNDPVVRLRRFAVRYGLDLSGKELFKVAAQYKHKETLKLLLDHTASIVTSTKRPYEGEEESDLVLPAEQKEQRKR